MKKEALRFESVNVEDYRYGGLLDATFCLYQGETLALAGLLRSGKKSLLSILKGELPNYGGDIFVFGEEKILNSDTTVSNCGIVSIGENLLLFNNLSLSDNICLSRGRKKLFSLIDSKIDDTLTRRLLLEMKIDILKKTVDMLTSFERTKFEILKAIYSGAHIIVFTSAFMYVNENEAKELCEIIKVLNDFGVSVILESDNDFLLYKEVIQRILVIRNGIITITIYKNENGQFDENIIRHVIAGHSYNKPNYEGGGFTPNKIVAEFLKITNLMNRQTITISRSSIIGIYDPDEKVPKTAEGLIEMFNKEYVMYINGERINAKNVADLVEQRISIITKEFANDLIFDNLSPVDNVCLHANHMFGNQFIYHRRTAKYLYERIVRKYEVLSHCVDIKDRTNCHNLSYEQQYELMVAKWLAINPKIIIIYAPLCNHDIKNAELYRNLQLKLSKEGKSLIIIASNSDYLQDICSRIFEI